MQKAPTLTPETEGKFAKNKTSYCMWELSILLEDGEKAEEPQRSLKLTWIWFMQVFLLTGKVNISETADS